MKCLWLKRGNFDLSLNKILTCLLIETRFDFKPIPTLILGLHYVGVNVIWLSIDLLSPSDRDHAPIHMLVDHEPPL